jgi:hypothetical protein
MMARRAGFSEPWATPEQRAHAQLFHRGIVEHGHFNAKFIKRFCHASELDRTQDIRRFIDQVAREDRARSDRIGLLEGCFQR